MSLVLFSCYTFNDRHHGLHWSTFQFMWCVIIFGSLFRYCYFKFIVNIFCHCNTSSLLIICWDVLCFAVEGLWCQWHMGATCFITFVAHKRNVIWWHSFVSWIPVPGYLLLDTCCLQRNFLCDSKDIFPAVLPQEYYHQN